MLRKIVLAGLVAAAAVPAAAAQPAPRALPRAITAAEVADAIAPRLPQTFGPGEALIGAVAEGRTLVLTYEVAAALAAAQSPEALSARYAGTFCGSSLGDAFFRSGDSLRIDSIVGGRAAPRRAGPLVTSCAGFPAPAPAPRR